MHHYSSLFILPISHSLTLKIQCQRKESNLLISDQSQMRGTTTLSLATKIQLYNTIIVPIAIYASETWKMTIKIAQKLNVFNQKCLRRILGISYRDHITNEEVLRLSACRRLQDIVTKKRLKFGGHAIRMGGNRHARIPMDWTPAGGKRKKGRPKTTWRRTFTEDLQQLNVTWREKNAVVANRVKSRAFVAQCSTGSKRS